MIGGANPKNIEELITNSENLINRIKSKKIRDVIELIAEKILEIKNKNQG